MDAGTPDKPSQVTPQAADDIPVARRELPTTGRKSGMNPVIVAGTLSAIGVAALVSGVLFSLRMQQAPTPDSTLAAVNPPPTTASPSASPTAAADTLLGHYAYTEAPLSELAPISDDGTIKLRKDAAAAYRQMAAAALQAGVSLVPISGFRSISDQKSLYFDVKAERGQVPSERAKVSAPPGYSEHHTGYAIDIGDAEAPATNLSPSFERTSAYRWLKENAAHYSFELSFPKNNKQGVSYEPWHWRYVGDIQSLKTFYKARGQQGAASPAPKPATSPAAENSDLENPPAEQ